jgi:ATP-dependent DNA helicase RecQ
MEGRDSVVILPTGGGKSLCFQLPALLMEGMAVIVSPLIALMKDQVDQLRARGVRAACLNSSLSPKERWEVERDIESGNLDLLYVAPERLLNGSFLMDLKERRLSFFAIDEAHCISQWGHDFRPEYRGLRRLREVFPGIGLHAYTATATEKVRADIVQQLSLSSPEVLVGSFDRPNLHYSVSHTSKRRAKLVELLYLIDRHKGESGIVYCISRKNVEQLAATLNDNGCKALPYHAGMEDEARKKTQEAFLNEEVDIIVATVAFGMGIDKTNVRYVVHWGIPKTIEHYQQESGRAGRDGLDSDCLLFYSPGDATTWRRILEELEPEQRRISYRQLEEMESYCHSTDCRHRFLVGYFGQTLESEVCEACDLCTGEVEPVADSLVVAQKILSCVVRVGGRFGSRYVADVLTGAEDPKVRANGHEELSTFGLLQEHPRSKVEGWISQLLGYGYLSRDPEFRTLAITPKGREVLKGEIQPRLVSHGKPSTQTGADHSWEGVDMDLFDKLKQLRLQTAREEGRKPFHVFSDVTLRDMARKRPTSEEGFSQVEGVGRKKTESYARSFMGLIREHCDLTGVSTDVYGVRSRRERRILEAPTGAKREAFLRFAEGQDVATVAAAIERAPSTTSDYLAEYLEREGVTDCTPWLDPHLHARIAQAGEKVGLDRLKPIFEELGEEIPYDAIRISVACLRNLTPAALQETPL